MANVLGETLVYNAGIETTKEYLRGERIKKVSANIKVLINPFIPPLVPIELYSSDMGGLIQTCEWAKSRSMPGGMYTLRIAADDRAITKNIKAEGFFKSIWNLMGRSAEDLFKPMAVAQLWIDGYHWMTGYVMQCRKTKQANGEVFYNVEISELGNLYSQNICSNQTIYSGISNHTIDDLKKILNLSNKLVGVPLWAALWQYANAFITSSLAYGAGTIPPYWMLSDGLPAAFRFIIQPAPIGGIAINSLLASITTDSTLFKSAGGSSFWDFLKTLTPSPYIEMFTESGGRTISVGRLFSGGAPTGELLGLGTAGIPLPSTGTSIMMPGFSYLIARTSPLGNPLLGLCLWSVALFPFLMGVFDLIIAGDYVIITDDDVISKDLGKSESQQSTIFQAPLGGKAGSGDAAKMFGRPSIAKGPILPFMPGGARTYGAREMTAGISAHSLSWSGVVGQSVEKVAAQTAGFPNSLLPIAALSSLLKYWFRNASNFKEGTVNTRLIPYAKPGMALIYMPSSREGAKMDNIRDYGIYYIDNVQGAYNIGQAPNSTFSLIRGVPIPFGGAGLANLKHLLWDWQINPIGLNLFDGDPSSG
jgi:hypothetical protein